MTLTEDRVAKAAAAGDVEGVLRTLFEGSPPRCKLGVRRETEVWDFKQDLPRSRRESGSDAGWAHIAADIIALHNNRGGAIIFGVDDRRHDFVGATRSLDSKAFNDGIRAFVGDSLWVDFTREFIQDDQRFMGIALVRPRGPSIVRFKRSAPEVNGKRYFLRAGSALRENDSTRILDPQSADQLARSQSATTFGSRYSINEPYFRLLAPEYENFFDRGELGRIVEASINDGRITTTGLIGVGGLGKTALATWVVKRAYEAEQFQYIISATAKDRELTNTGILGLQVQTTSFEVLLNQIAEVLGFPDLKQETIGTREQSIKELLGSGQGLLFVDNLETIDDKRLVGFLEDLPTGVKALVTSRRHSVRTASRPIDIPPMTDAEVLRYLRLLQHEKPYAHLSALSDEEILRLGTALDGIPLALRWVIGRNKDVISLMRSVEVLHADAGRGELLEFSFRRVFDDMKATEKRVLETISVLEQPLTTEALVAGCGHPEGSVLDAVDTLVEDAIVQRVFDSEINDYCFTVLTLTRSFVRIHFRREPNRQQEILRNLTNWFEARDVRNEDERLVIRELRTGGTPDDTALVDLAIGAKNRGDFPGAENLFRQAAQRNPRSWRAAREGAEFFRHDLKDHVEALKWYDRAGANAPKAGQDRLVILREWGRLLMTSGRPDALSLAEEKFLAALEANPKDLITRLSLATCYDKRGVYRRVIEILESESFSVNPKTQKSIWPLLLKAYEKTNELLKAADLKSRIQPG